MASITTRTGKGSPLTTAELDANFTNLNTSKPEKSGESVSFADLTVESVAATLHRSPNAITSLFIYDTSKDSDGGAWTEKCQHTSWYNETIYGKWLGAQASEAAARAVTGATTDDYFQLTTNGAFYKLNAGSGVTEVFRGNKRAFPKVAAIVAEAASVTIYDLTETGRPMWMRFVATGADTNPNNFIIGHSGWPLHTAKMVSGYLCLHTGADPQVDQAMVADFTDDSMYEIVNAYGILKSRQRISSRNSTSVGFVARFGNWPGTNCDIVKNYGYGGGIRCYSMDVIVTKNSKLNSFGLRIPTLASLGSSVCVYPNLFDTRHLTAYSVSTGGFLPDGTLIASGSTTTYIRRDPFTNSWTSVSNSSAPGLPAIGGADNVSKKDRKYKYGCFSGTKAYSIIQADTIGSSLTTAISDTYNTGWLAGDIRRAYLSDVNAGSVAAPNLINSAPIPSGANTVEVDGDYYKITYVNNTYGAGWNLAGFLDPNKRIQVDVTTYAAMGNTLRLRVSYGGAMDTIISGSTPITKSYVLSGLTGIQITLMDFDSGEIGWIKASIKELISDRSYKAAASNIYGTLTSTAVNTGNSLVGYSGFSGSNYIQEPYSADLDFGTGEWSAGAWVNVPVTLPSDSSFPVSPTELITNGGSGFSDTSGWSSASQGTISVSGGAATFTTLAGDTLGGAARAFTTVSGSRYRITIDCQSLPVSGSGRVGVGSGVNNSDWFNSVGAVNITTTGVTTLYFTAQGTSAYINVYAVSGNTSANQSLVLNSVSVRQLMPLQIAARAHATGPYITLGIDATNKLTSTAYDGTTTRTVTSSAAYNTGTWLKADATYGTDGALKLWVNGVNVATTTGTPLLSLSSRYNLLTYTEDFTNAAWIATNASKTSASVITATGTSNVRMVQAATAPLLSQYVYRARVLKGRNFVIGLAGSTSGVGATFNGTTGVYAASTSTLTKWTLDAYSCTTDPEDSNYWLASVTATNTVTDTSVYALIAINNSLGTTWSTGWDATVGDTLTAKKHSVTLANDAFRPYQRVGVTTDFDFQAPLTIGNSYALDAPFPGSIALLKFSATVPTAEQTQFMYEQEKHLFAAGAQCVLPASTSVLDLAYDDRTDTWSTLQATYESSFSGLVRTSTQAPSAGSFSKSAAGSGIKLLARTTTNPGVDVQMPKRNLKDDRLADLVDDNILVFDFDAVTSQTDFALPMGYTARAVYSAGAQKREGSTKDWTRLFDGFLETIRFGTAPGNGVWVQIHAVKEVV